MTEDRKKPGVAFWAIVALIVVFVGYPLSMEPAWWVHTHIALPQWAMSGMEITYRPLSWLIKRTETTTVWAGWYLSLWFDQSSPSPPWGG